MKKDIAEPIAQFVMKKLEYLTNISIPTVFVRNTVAMSFTVFQDYKKSQQALTLC